MLKNGKSNHQIELINSKIVKKEKNKNWKITKLILETLNKNNFKHAIKLLDEDDKFYYYEYVEGYFYYDVEIMTDKQITKIIEIILQLHQYKINNKYIVHGDISSVNLSFNQRTLEPEIIIDWDGSYLGNKYDDIAYVCWLWVNFGNPNNEARFYLDKLTKIIKLLNYNNNDIEKIKQSIIKRINKDSKKHQNNKFLSNWYHYCLEWINKNWKYLYYE